MIDPYKYLQPSECRERELSDRYSHLMDSIEAAVNATDPDAVVEETLSGDQFLALDVAARLRLGADTYGTFLVGVLSILEEKP
jgi:hypothetical protein